MTGKKKTDKMWERRNKGGNRQ